MNFDLKAHRHNQPSHFHFNRRIKVGILGGSFNPAHDGHLHISKVAKQQLDLDEVWWIVTPQNRLKTEQISNTYTQRLNETKTYISKITFIRVLDYEYKYNLSHSYESLLFLKKRSRITKFIWLMGSDNIISFPKWIKPYDIVKIFPIAVIERPSYSYGKLNSLGAKILGRRLNKKFKYFQNKKISYWYYLKSRLNFSSSSKIRDKSTSSYQ